MVVNFTPKSTIDDIVYNALLSNLVSRLRQQTQRFQITLFQVASASSAKLSCNIRNTAAVRAA